jgi:putative flippase GtrA
MQLLKQLHGYFWVGTIAFVIDAGILFILVELGLYYILANTISFITANVFNFLAGHYLVFGKRTRLQSMVHSYIAVLSISAAGLLLNNAAMYVAVEWIKASLLVAKVAATVIVLLWNFGARKRWVYA